MSFCPRPSKVGKTAYGSTGTATVNPPGQRTEACDTAATSSTTAGGSGTSTETVVQGPIGPMGPAGADGRDGISVNFLGQFELNKQYKKTDPDTYRFIDVVTYAGQTFAAIADNISTTEENPEHEPGVDTASWTLWAAKGVDGLSAQDKSLLDNVNDILDWVQNASIEDWIGLAAKAIGIAIAGAIIVDMLTDDGTGDGNADQRFNGTPGYAGAYTAPPLAPFLQSLCDYADVQCDVSLIDPAQTIEMTIPSNSGTRDILEQLSLAYQFDMVTSGGILKFVPKKTAADITIPIEDMGFSTEGSAIPAPYTSKRFQGIDLPRDVSLTYYSTDFDYNPFTQSYSLFGYDQGQNVQLSVPVTLSHEAAKRICETSLINAHLERMNYKFNTTYKYCMLEPSDVINSPMGLVRVLRVDEADDGILEFEVCDAGTEDSYTGSGSDVQIPAPSTNVVTDIGYSQALFFDPNPLSDADTKVRIYAAVHGYGRTGWPGAAIYESKDGGASYEPLVRVYEESTVGLVATATPSQPYYVWDDSTTITVQLKTGSLETKNDLAVLNGQNWCYIGQEIIGFVNATLVGPKTYQLTRLLRGRQGTEIFTSTHEANELFVLLDGAPVAIEFDKNSDRLTTRKFKCVTIGSSPSVVDGQNIGIFSNNLRPWAVYNAAVVHQPNNDWTISWKGRARFDSKLKDYATSGNDSTFGGYGIAILDSSENVLKTYTTTSTTYTLTAAQQTADLGGLQSSLKVSIVPLDRVYGGGYPTIVNS